MSLFKRKSKQKYLKVLQDFVAVKEAKEMHTGDIILISNDVTLVATKDREKDFKKKTIKGKPIVQEIKL